MLACGQAEERRERRHALDHVGHSHGLERVDREDQGGEQGDPPAPVRLDAGVGPLQDLRGERQDQQRHEDVDGEVDEVVAGQSQPPQRVVHRQGEARQPAVEREAVQGGRQRARREVDGMDQRCIYDGEEVVEVEGTVETERDLREREQRASSLLADADGARETRRR